MQKIRTDDHRRGNEPESATPDDVKEVQRIEIAKIKIGDQQVDCAVGCEAKCADAIRGENGLEVAFVKELCHFAAR
jgi:hypothetical protein